MVREKLAAVFVATQIRWAVPLVTPPPGDLARLMRRAVSGTACTWWCGGRWWADRVLFHPQLGTAVYALQAAVRVAGCASGLLTACVQAHAAQLTLRPLHLSAEQGLWVKPLGGADARVREAARCPCSTTGRTATSAS